MISLSQDTRIERKADQPFKWSLVGNSVPGVSTHTIVINCETFRIGRRPEMDLAIESPVVSGFHAEIFQSDGLLYVRDAGSTNGTYVNGRRISLDTEVRDSDTIDFGGTSFRVVRRQNSPGSLPSKRPPAASKTFFVNDAVEAIGRRSLAQLLSGGELIPCYQTIHDLQTGKPAGFEFLARSGYPGLETAGQLFGQSAKAGREIELSILCRQQALHFSRLVDPALPVFVNTHPAEPLLDVVLPQMRELRNSYPDRGIVLEIHEGANTEPEMVRELRHQLSEINVRLAFDDFGAGQARIRELISASADYIKFDPSLIRDLLQASADQRRFFASIIQGIKNEGTITVAEGIETSDMAQVCHDVGFELVQGYLYSRPTLMKPV